MFGPSAGEFGCFCVIFVVILVLAVWKVVEFFL